MVAVSINNVVIDSRNIRGTSEITFDYNAGDILRIIELGESVINIHGLFIRANICCDQFYPKYLDVKIEIRSVDLDKCHLSRNLKVHGKRILPLFVIPKFNCLDLRLLLLLRWRLANKKSEI